MKRLPLFLTFILGGTLLVGALGCAGSDPYLEGARLDLRNEDYDRALENVETALEANPQNAEAYELKGQILQEQAFNIQDVDQHSELIQQMVEAYERAVELDPEMQDEINQRLRLAYYNEFQRGGQAFNRGREDEAEYGSAYQYFRNASLIQPDSTGAYVNQAYSLINAGRTQEAIAPFEQAIERGDADADTYLFLSDLYTQHDRAAEAVPLLEQANEQYPDNVELQSRLLNAYVLANQMDRAMDRYREQVERNPENALYRYNYGSLLLNAEQYDEAIEQLTEAVRLDPDYASAYYNLGASYINQAVAFNEQITEMDDALRAERNQLSEAQISQRETEIEGLVEQRRGYYRQAIEPLEQARQMLQAEGEDTTQVCQALFSAYAQTGQQEQAEAVAECAGYEDLIDQ